MLKSWFEDIDSYFARDPSARSRLEVVLCYGGLHALAIYRLTHFLWHYRLKLLARMLANVGRILTGIEIHPAATIGKRCFIDHGTGVVIGETAWIGDDVTIYHDVTLGGRSWDQGIRHPQLEDGVIVGAGAQLLGPIHVGKGARIGANAVVVRDVPEGATMVGIPARSVQVNNELSATAFAAYGMTSEGDESLEAQLEALKARITAIEEKLT